MAAILDKCDVMLRYIVGYDTHPFSLPNIYWSQRTIKILSCPTFEKIDEFKLQT